MTAVLVAMLMHGHCMNIPAAAWTYPKVAVLAYAKNTYGLGPRELAYLDRCISKPRPGDSHG